MYIYFSNYCCVTASYNRQQSPIGLKTTTQKEIKNELIERDRLVLKEKTEMSWRIIPVAVFIIRQSPGKCPVMSSPSHCPSPASPSHRAAMILK